MFHRSTVVRDRANHQWNYDPDDQTRGWHGGELIERRGSSGGELEVQKQKRLQQRKVAAILDVAGRPGWFRL